MHLISSKSKFKPFIKALKKENIEYVVEADFTPLHIEDKAYWISFGDENNLELAIRINKIYDGIKEKKPLFNFRKGMRT